jgi:tRNA (cytidine/uridine-2'-O-)-methyltransferase
VKQTHYDIKYQKGDWFVFGKETKGLPPEIIQKNLSQAVTIPQPGEVRSLNLATAVAISVYEGFRQVVHSSNS